jgi:hypothetical protein
MAFRMNCRCSHGSVHPFVDELTKEGALGSARKSNPRLGAERSSRTASVLQSTEKVGDPGGHKLLNRVLCPEPVTNGIADMTPRRPGWRMDFSSCRRFVRA